MTIAESLDGLRQKHPGCSLVAFGDLGTRLILRTSAARSYPQEYLDQICMLAAQTFSLSKHVQCTDHVSNDAVILTPQDATVLVRLPAGGSDFLCCLCEAGAQIEEVTASAMKLLHEIIPGTQCNA